MRSKIKQLQKRVSRLDERVGTSGKVPPGFERAHAVEKELDEFMKRYGQFMPEPGTEQEKILVAQMLEAAKLRGKELEAEAGEEDER